MFLRNRPSRMAPNLYKAALSLYPATFRNRYGSEMLLIFRQSHPFASGGSNWAKRLVFWFCTFKDLATSLPAVWYEQFRPTGLSSARSATDLVPVFVLVGAVIQVDGGVATALTHEIHSPHRFDWSLVEANLMFSIVLAFVVLGLVAALRRRRSEISIIKLC